MKRIKYEFLSATVNHGTDECPIIEHIFLSTEMPYSDVNLMIAKKEAYGGEYTIVDDGQPEVVTQPTTEDLLNALLGVTA